MISFYPGPSKVEEKVPLWVRKAYQQGILSINHRSPEFADLYRQTEKILKKRLNIPADYRVVFTSSATECWEIIAQSLVSENSHHFFNGAFGRKWFDYTSKIRPAAVVHPFDLNRLPDFDKIGRDQEILCLTQNETSNGTQIPYKVIKEVRARFPETLICLDVTSSLAGIRLPISSGDVWFASVQKCFGLPAGMAVFICSPRAVDRAQDLVQDDHYNSLNFVLENGAKYQTHLTPNLLAIYLLHKVMSKRRKISRVGEAAERRMATWIKLLKDHKHLGLLVENDATRSDTVLAIRTEPETLSILYSQAADAGFVLGRGYGELKTNTFRIANFPSLTDQEIRRLQVFLSDFSV